MTQPYCAQLRGLAALIENCVDKRFRSDEKQRALLAIGISRFHKRGAARARVIRNLAAVVSGSTPRGNN
jgi:hypothetical protein